MFNAANVNNRLRELVRGRVIVATTSKIVEFLDRKLKFSYPLYSVDQMPPGVMLTFCVEVDGFLTFDQDAEIKILPETAHFEKLHYDPTAFALVRTADPFVPLISNAYVGRYDGPNSSPSALYVSVQYGVNLSEEVYLNVDQDTYDYSKEPLSWFPIGKPWFGMKNLPKGIYAPFPPVNIP